MQSHCKHGRGTGANFYSLLSQKISNWQVIGVVGEGKKPIERITAAMKYSERLQNAPQEMD